MFWDLKQRVKILEEKVKHLEETIAILENMMPSEQIESFIQSRIISSGRMRGDRDVSNKQTSDYLQEKNNEKNIQAARDIIENQKTAALKETNDLSIQSLGDTSLFSYEPESGITISTVGFKETEEADPALSAWIGKGMRITSYNGFDTDKIIIPREIEGKPVISIGIKAFINCTAREIILPDTIKIIAGKGFQGCKNLRHICLPQGIEYLGDGCFSQSGLELIVIPDTVKFMLRDCFSHCNSLKSAVIPGTVKAIPVDCFFGCTGLSSVSLGKEIKGIGMMAFYKCKSLKQLILPETIEEIGSASLGQTSIKTQVFPCNVKMVKANVLEWNVNQDVTCVFLGQNTEITEVAGSYKLAASLVYCLAGSKVQAYARENRIAIKPLSEFAFSNSDKWY